MYSSLIYLLNTYYLDGDFPVRFLYVYQRVNPINN